MPQVLGKALSMKIDVDAVLDYLAEETDRCGSAMCAIMQVGQDRLMQWRVQRRLSPDRLEGEKTDLDLLVHMYALRYEKLEQVDDALRGIRDAIHGKTLAMLDRCALREEATEEHVRVALKYVISLAIRQMKELLVAPTAREVFSQWLRDVAGLQSLPA